MIEVTGPRAADTGGKHADPSVSRLYAPADGYELTIAGVRELDWYDKTPPSYGYDKPLPGEPGHAA